MNLTKREAQLLLKVIRGALAKKDLRDAAEAIKRLRQISGEEKPSKPHTGTTLRLLPLQCPARYDVGIYCERKKGHKGLHSRALSTGGYHRWK